MFEILPLQAGLLTRHSWLHHGFGTRYNGAWTPQERTARLHQVHGNAAIAVAEPGHHGDGDALITATRNLWLEIRTADCVPVLIADPVRQIVAAVHAGWRGTASQIAAKTAEALIRDWGCQPVDLECVIGPAIGPCCFEVGLEVAEHFPLETSWPKGPDARPHIDLRTANRRQLICAGVLPEKVADLNHCTACDAERFHSFRRDRGTGRMVSAIRIGPQK